MEILHKDTGKVLLEVEGSSLREVYLKGADLRGADLRWADLTGADLREADLRDTNLRDVNLEGANLRKANLYGADLRGASLYGVDLYSADLRGVDLRDADLRRADLRGTKGILSFIGEKHLLVYFKYDNTYYFKIGCMTRTAKEWLNCFEEVGKENGYSEENIKLYGDVIRLYSKYEFYKRRF